MNTKEKAFSWVDGHQDRMIDLWKKLVSIDSGIGVKEGGMEIANCAADYLKGLGFSIRRYSFDECGDTIIGERGDLSKPYVLLMGHLDTVFHKGEVEKRPFTIKDGKAYGPGVLDMKGGDTIALSSLSALHDAGYDFSCKVIFVCDEEPAHCYSNNPDIIRKEAEGALCAFNFETGFTDHDITVQRRGCWRFYLETFGRGSHVGNDPKTGRSAILEMAHKIIDIENLTDYDKGYNVNVGTITGGTVANATPAYCKVECDFRYVSNEDLPKLRAMEEDIVKKVYVKDVTTKLTESHGFAVMERIPGNMKLLETAQAVCRENGWPIPGPKLCGGGSDAAYTCQAGVPTLCSIGVEGSRNHTVEEWADVESLFARTKLMIALLLTVTAPGYKL